MKLVILFCLLKAALIVGQLDWRIIGGRKEYSSRFPFMVSLRLHDKHICGASFISPTYLLTAARCIGTHEPQDFSVQYGTLKISKDRTNVLDVIRVVKHESYDPTTHYNDIAVLEVNDGIPTSIHPAYMPTDANDLPNLRYDFATVVGWGKIKPNSNKIMKHKQWLDLETYNRHRCNSAFREYNEEIQMCVGRIGVTGPCTGDHGDPVMYSYTIYGIISRIHKPCGSAPSIVTKVAAYRDWIREKTGI